MFRAVQVSDEGVQAIGADLHMKASLKVLVLQENQISDAGEQAMGAALHKNTSLKDLEFGLNQDSIKGAQAMGASLHVIYPCRNSTWASIWSLLQAPRL